MNILRENKSFRALAISAFFNKLGSSMYNLVFVSFAATMPNNKLAVGIANIIVLIPVFFTLYIAEKPLPKALISKIDSNINVKFVFSDFWKTSFKPK